MKAYVLKFSLFAFATLFATGIFSIDANAQQKLSVAEIMFTKEPFKQVLAAAKASGKLVFVDAFATWCAPCKELQKTTFKDAKAAAYFNKHFINYTIDVEKGEGIGLTKTWQIEGLPTLLILNSNGKVLASHTGYVDGKGLMEFASETVAK